MIDRIRSVVTCIFFEEYTQPACQFPQLIELTRDAERRVAIGRNVFRQYRRCVALGIHADENDARQRSLSHILELASCGAQGLQCEWANVRASRESKKHEVPLSNEDVLINASTFVVKQGEHRHVDG